MNSTISSTKRKAGLTLSAFLLALIAFILLPYQGSAQSYSGPIVIRNGGTYTGNWESRDSNVPAVEINTSEPVVIVNSNIRGAGRLIRFTGAVANITVRHTNGYGLTPTPWRDFKQTRNFLAADEFKNIIVENCYLEGVAGINIGGRYQGNGTPSETIKIRYNKVKNIDGRVYNGSAIVQFVGFHFKGGVSHAEVAWNQIINEANNSLVEDNINIHNARGTASSPIKIHNNYIQGAYPMPATSTSYTGGGILADGDGGSDTCPAYIEVYENQLIGLGAYSLGIAGGHNIRYHHNRAINATTFADGSPYRMYTGGMWSKDYYHKGVMYANSVDNNTVAIFARNYPNQRNNVTVSEGADFRDNNFPLTLINLLSERDEYSSWNRKLQQNGIVIGPNGSGGTPAPANQKPTVAISTPKAGASFAETGSIEVTVSANDSDGSIKVVELFNGSTKVGEEFQSPYNFSVKNLNAGGSYNLVAKATDDKGETSTSATVSVDVTKTETSNPTPPSTTTPSPGTAGKITREYWAGVTGSNVSAVPVGTAPTQTTTLTLFEAPSGVADTYGQRIRGYVTAPVSGQYTFWISGDDAAELYLSTSDNPAGKRKIAAVTDWTERRQWDKNDSQQSAKITLEAGKRYYIEALHLEAWGGDNLAVGWQLPDGAIERPIAGNRLSPIGSVAENNVVPVNATTGKISRQVWTEVYATTVGGIPLSKAPNTTSELTTFEAPSGFAHNYGQRIRGYITAPQSGEYTFWIAGDDEAELWLGTSENPGSKRKIAYVSGMANFTESREWDKYSSQRSAKITLKAGERYYIEALHLEMGGGDNLAVGWQLPNGGMERPIAGNRLSPFGDSFASTSNMQVSSTAEKAPYFEEATAYPNPFSETITLYLGSQETALKAVVLLDQAGRVAYTQKELALENNRLTIDLSGAGLEGGLYFLRYTDGTGSSKTIKVIKQ